MSDMILSLSPAPTLAVSGHAARFPVGRIFCIGRNYADHSREMGHDPDREPPFFFLKPASAVTTAGKFKLPSSEMEIHHEVELVAALHKGGKNIAVADALDCVFGYCVGLDMTQRDVQARAKKLGRPWDVAKGFDGSAPLGEIVPAREIGHPEQGRVSLSVGGKLRQSGNLNLMIWSVAEIISIISQSFALAPGDLIMTGTPAGIGPVNADDELLAEVEGLPSLMVSILPSQGG